MRQKILGETLLNWLYDHFDKMEDPDICAYLTKEKKKENASEIRSLECKLITANKKEQTKENPAQDRQTPVFHIWSR